MTYRRVAVTVDVLLFSEVDRRLQLLVVKRKNDPFKGRWALPGGFIEPEENLEQAARRELREETGINVPRGRLSQLAAYGDPHRDPRGRTVSVAFIGTAKMRARPAASDDAADARWVEIPKLLRSKPGMAFDHAKIVRDAILCLRAASSAPL
jgi:8-oxo-dGTP diphosphatase